MYIRWVELVYYIDCMLSFLTLLYDPVYKHWEIKIYLLTMLKPLSKIMNQLQILVIIVS